MQKVKVHRYISGKRPEYAKDDSDESSQDEDFIDNKKSFKIGRMMNIRDNLQRDSSDSEDNDEVNKYERSGQVSDDDEAVDDPRLRRLITARKQDDNSDERHERHRRHVARPERASSSSASSSDDEENSNLVAGTERTRRISICSESDSGSNEASDDEIERRRQILREKALKQREVELMQKEEENIAVASSSSSEEESTEYEDESEEDREPRLKPQFIRRRDRTTIIEKEKDLVKQKQLEQEAKKAAKERRKQTLRLVEDSIKKDMEAAKAEKDPHINDVNTDDENEEIEYETWKLRELKRLKRDREEREAVEKEKDDIERMRNLPEEERLKELKLNPKKVTNKTHKGKYKFLQKYYHRGAFYLDKEEDVFKQDFSAPTLEDHFDKTVLPKVMQVKNFGRCGRTKYTHLVDQDTTKFDSPWLSETANNDKFVRERAGGMKQNFDKPSYRRKN